MSRRAKPGPGRPPRPRALGLSLERRRVGWSRAQAWTHFGVSRATWARWETGAAAPEADALIHIAAAWGATVDRLLAKPSARAAVEVAAVERRRRLAADLERLAVEHGRDAVRDAVRAAPVDL